MIQQRADLSPRLTYSLTFPDKKSRYLRNFAKGSTICHSSIALQFKLSLPELCQATMNTWALAAILILTTLASVAEIAEVV